jgi:hypothetical protein
VGERRHGRRVMAFSQRLFDAIVNGKPPLAKSFVE